MNFKKLAITSVVVLFAMSCGSQSRVITTKKERDKYEKKEVKVVYNDDKEETTPPPVNTTPETPTSSPSPITYANSVEEYIGLYSGIAKDEMVKYGIPASITLAQGILESGIGKSELAVKANNHFGIKCHKDWQGERAYRTGDTECFRKYTHPLFSFEDHSLFLKRSRYDFLFSLRKDDYAAWAKGLRAAGYATDRKYPEKLINIIEKYQLDKYDAEVLALPPQEPVAETIPSQTSEITYVIKQGDTLYSIAKKYGITVKELMAINDLTSSAISIGQSIKIRTSN